MNECHIGKKLRNILWHVEQRKRKGRKGKKERKERKEEKDRTRKRNKRKRFIKFFNMFIILLSTIYSCVINRNTQRVKFKSLFALT